jgi:hypothetical protein
VDIVTVPRRLDGPKVPVPISGTSPGRRIAGCAPSTGRPYLSASDIFGDQKTLAESEEIAALKVDNFLAMFFHGISAAQ